ncbi:DUF4209 domain-containing protein [Alkalicoccus halolimnae]|uniref:DUF4209 domain-containing protein n=1 Tax=Alkalicoccus halolimnae TaxID=1667239 RepID=A0A5C7FHQ9_9BACI|nr:DUF4209 domain-containing protein [Alkalicoccus halolimnae]TXF83338.1 DUF4209 domain-containing protein [Alkalicoccus halolimnae]
MDDLNKVITELEKMSNIDSMIEIKRKLVKVQVNENDNTKFNYEKLAFSFLDEQENGFNLGCYFGVGIISKETSELDKINENAIDYWQRRVEESTNCILIARYSDLIWEISKIFKGYDGYTYGLKAIDAYLEIVKNLSFNNKSELIKVSKRSLNLALSLRDSNRIHLAKKIMIELEDNIAVDKLPGTWGFSFDNLINNKKLKLSQEEVDTIIYSLEKRLERLMTEENVIHAIKSVIIRIISYYGSKREIEKVHEFLEKLEETCQMHETRENVFSTEANLQELYQLYKEYGLREEASRILVKISRLGPLINEKLIRFEKEIEIPKEDLKQFLDAIVQGDLEQDVINVCLMLIPKSKDVEKQVGEFKSLLTQSLPSIILSNEGRRAATIRSAEEDFKGNIIKTYADLIEVRLGLINLVIKEFIYFHSLDHEKLLSILTLSPAFDKRKIELIKKGLILYFEDEYIAAIHVLLPQIENALRNIIRNCDGATIKANTNKGGFDVITLNDILNSEILLEVYNIDTILYLKATLNDSRGLNLRNNILHGLSGINNYNEKIASLMVQILLIISLFKEETEVEPTE